MIKSDLPADHSSSTMIGFSALPRSSHLVDSYMCKYEDEKFKRERQELSVTLDSLNKEELVE